MWGVCAHAHAHEHVCVCVVFGGGSREADYSYEISLWFNYFFHEISPKAFVSNIISNYSCLMNTITNKGEKVGLLFNQLHKNDVLFKFKRKESHLIIKAPVR